MSTNLEKKIKEEYQINPQRPGNVKKMYRILLELCDIHGINSTNVSSFEKELGPLKEIETEQDWNRAIKRYGDYEVESRLITTALDAYRAFKGKIGDHYANILNLATYDLNLEALKKLRNIKKIKQHV